MWMKMELNQPQLIRDMTRYSRPTPKIQLLKLDTWDGPAIFSDDKIGVLFITHPLPPSRIFHVFQFSVWD